MRLVRHAEAGERRGSPDRGPSWWLWLMGFPARAVLLGVLWGYRRLVSPALGPRCRFHPSCSEYAEEAIRVHGAAKGLLLAVWRVLRCSPLTPGGLDPVPGRGTWRAGRGDASPYVNVIQPRKA